MAGCFFFVFDCAISPTCVTKSRKYTVECKKRIHNMFITATLIKMSSDNHRWLSQTQEANFTCDHYQTMLEILMGILSELDIYI